METTIFMNFKEEIKKSTVSETVKTIVQWLSPLIG
jgi:hypothetical protein